MPYRPRSSRRRYQQYKRDLKAHRTEGTRRTAAAHAKAKPRERQRSFFQLFAAVNWVGCLQTAMDSSVRTIVEFGGGIGKGEGPDEKRPNLDGIIKKTLKAADYEAEYVPAINVDSLRAAAEALA